MRNLRAYFAVFLSLAIVMSALSMTIAQLTAGEGRLITICSGALTKTIVVDENGEPLDAQPVCPDCFVPLAFVSVAALDIVRSNLVLQRLGREFPDGNVFIAERKFKSPRGPPVLI